MKTNHSDIILHYVPARRTGVFRACDHSLKWSYHTDVISDILGQVEENVTKVEVDKRVEWLWDAYKTLNNEKTVKKAFEMCRTKEWNLSYNCLTGFTARERLRNLKAYDPEFYNELMANRVPEETTEYPEDDKTLTKDEEGDDSDLPIETVVAHTVDLDVAASIFMVDGTAEPAEVDPTAFERGPGKRKVRKNPRYSSDAFWRH
ncbi:hypothetical protein V8E52_010958 [Russula decolorans]